MKNTSLLLLAAFALRAAPLNAAGPISAWEFNEENGAQRLIDSAGSSSGTLVDVTFEKSEIGSGNVAVFNGATSKVVFDPYGESKWRNFERGNFTVTGCFRLLRNDAREDMPLIIAGNARSKSGWALQVGRADRTRKGALFFTVGGAVDKEVVLVQSLKRVDDGAWHWFAAVVRDEAAELYVDGVLQGRTPFNPSTNSSPGASPVMFGSNGKVFFNGKLDRIRLYGDALSEVLDGSKKLSGGELHDDWSASSR